MVTVLLLCSAALVLVALAVGLWSSASAREQRRLSTQHAEQRLTRADSAPRLAGLGDAPAPMPVSSAVPAGAPWDALMRRAAMPTGWRVPLLILAGAALLAWITAARLDTAWAVPIVLVLSALASGFWISRRISRLQSKLLRQLPDFLDNLVRLAALGNSLQMAFQTSAAQVPMPLRGLLDTTLSYTRSGLDLDRALAQAAQPYRLEALNVLSVVLGVSVRIGGRADQILQRMADFMRDLDQAQQELMATTSETRMSAWVLGLLPPISAVLMAITSPDFFQPIIHEPLGHKLLLWALGLEMIGGFLLYRLAKSI
ncbi:type II secretion system F family protein [Stenotrophomonas sp. SRS1]|uniref:type II secretion system F family protein n=1 Tax=Stenotrophomonas sp. SRS1 TaxID=2870345 RepID=UPI002238D693|nr:type II secretion system F family protein [Stenotrophomonas sp. SRS1]MCW6026924.1 type II secretion system F family protein [Stenotrophomonas sp. SRS1]